MDRLALKFAAFPEPPYYAAIFTSHSAVSEDIKEAFAAEAFSRATRYPSFIGVERAREAGGFGVVVLYWRSYHDLKRWGDSLRSLMVPEGSGADTTAPYDRFILRVAVVDAQYGYGFGDALTLSDTEPTDTG